MFDIGWSELLVIGIVALVVIGPKELPGVVRAVAQNIGKLRRLAADFQNQFSDAMREMELADLKKDAEKLISDATKIDDVKKVEDEIKQAVEEPVPTEDFFTPSESDKPKVAEEKPESGDAKAKDSGA